MKQRTLDKLVKSIIKDNKQGMRLSEITADFTKEETRLIIDLLKLYKLKAYSFSIDGLALGGEIVVLANSTKSAREVANNHLREKNHTTSSLNLISTKNVPELKVAYYNNGDY